MKPLSLSKLSAMLRDGQGEAALSAVVAATEAAPDNADAWAMRAFVEDLLERFDEAEHSIGQSLMLDPSPDYQFKRASIRLKAGHIQAACADAEAVAAMGEPFFRQEALLLAAEAKRRLGRWQEAIDACGALPDDAEVWCGGLIRAGEVRTQCQRMLVRRMVA
jgi:Tfp pilus assembly protein PilF